MNAEQINIFTDGMNTDFNEAILNNRAYPLAYNVQKINHRLGIQFELSNQDHTVSQRSGDKLIPVSSIPIHYEVKQLYPCVATYEGIGEIPSVVVLASDPANGYSKIALIRSDNDQHYLIFDDDQAPARPRWEPLNLGDEIDGFTWADSAEKYFYWTDNVNPIRYIPLRVKNPSVTDNSVSGLSPLYIANEPDLLYVQRLSPVDMIEVSEVNQTGGGLRAGSYQFSYQYFNTKTKTKSAIHLLTNPVPVILSNTHLASTNEIQGGGPGHNTGKSITVKVAKSHFHHYYYDSIILYVVKKIGSEVAVVDKLSPSKEFYGQADSDSFFTYTGNESVSASTVQEVTTQYSQIIAAKTIKESDGRMYLGAPTYADLDVPDSPDMSGETIVKELPVPIDPMNAQPAHGQGYYDELNNYKYKGYFRDEVYSFGQTYFNKFQMFSRVKPIEFKKTPNQVYDETNHTNTWQYNWIDGSASDWKFVSRKSKEGSLFSQSSDSIRAMGLRVQGITNHPEWAYGICVFRRDRIENIIGQTPVVNSSFIQGGASAISQELADERSNGLAPYEDSSNWDYDGSEDCIEPKIIACSLHKHLILHGMEAENNPNKKIYIPETDFAYAPGVSGLEDKSFCNLYFLYPLEYLSNSNNQAYKDIDQDDRPILEVIDLVALDAFTTVRRENIYRAGNDLVERFLELGYLFAPRAKESYFYFNNDPGELDANIPFASNSLKASRIYKQVSNGGVIITSNFWSNDRRFSHINKIQNLQALFDNQSTNEFSIFKPLEILSGRLSVNSRGLIFGSQPGSENQIYDPNKFILDNISPALLANLFPIPGGLNLSSHTNLQGIQERRASQLIFINWQFISGLRFMNPQESTFLFISNITKGLGDNRYGSSDVANSYVFTGAIEPISEADINSQRPISLDVWGGDCIISRASFRVRSNAPRIVELDPNEKENRQYYGAYKSQDYVFHGGHTKVSGYKYMHELVDLWVESKVNGHYVFRNTEQYPLNVKDRDILGVGNGNGEYEYSLTARFDTGFYNLDHLYNYAYSSENRELVLSSIDLAEVINNKANARIHFSLQRIQDSSTIGFDEWLVGNTYDLQGTYGPLTKIVVAAGKRIYCIQEDGVGVVSLGSTLTEDANGLAINIKSGNVIGYFQYVSSNNETGGDFGGQHQRAILSIENGIFVFDKKRKRLFQVSGLNDIGYNRVSKFISTVPGVSDDSELKMGFDPIDGRLLLFSRSSGNPTQALSYLNRVNQFESILLASNLSVYGMANAGGNNYVAIRHDQRGLEFYKFMSEVADRRSYFGDQAISYLYYALNQGSPQNYNKIIKSVEVQSAVEPSYMQGIIYHELNSLQSTRVAEVQKHRRGNRQNSYFYSKWRNLENQSMLLADPNFYLGVVMFLKEHPVSISSVKTNYRTRSRIDHGRR